MIALKVTQVGNSLGVVLSKEALAQLSVGKGDTIYLTNAPDGSMRISAYSQEVADEIVMGKAFMHRYRDTFKALAK